MRISVLLIVIIAMSFSVSSQVKQSFNSDAMMSLSASSQETISARNSGVIGSDIVAYPSPFKTSFVIESSLSVEIKDVTIANILGKNVPVVVDYLGSKVLVSFDSGVPDGIYLCKITLEKEIKTIRMVKSSR